MMRTACNPVNAPLPPRPRLTASEVIEQSAAMAHRFNRLMLRTLRALRDLRRYPLPVLVRSAGQVNVAQQQLRVRGEGRARAQHPGRVLTDHG